MRIATWNIERRARGLACEEYYDRAIRDLDADVVVITEPGLHFTRRHPDAVVSPTGRPGAGDEESWIAVLGSGLQPLHRDKIPYRHLAVATSMDVSGREIAIYGSVLPWNAARSQAQDVYGKQPRRFKEVFDLALQEQVQDVERLQEEFGQRSVFWAGDFNHPLVGPLRGFSGHARARIDEALKTLGMIALNRTSGHVKSGVHAIDLICGPSTLRYGTPEDSYPVAKGKPLSDHRAYVLDVFLS
jgi:hypothetical protein